MLQGIYLAGNTQDFTFLTSSLRIIKQKLPIHYTPSVNPSFSNFHCSLKQKTRQKLFKVLPFLVRNTEHHRVFTIMYWASLVGQTVKCLPTMRETQVQSLGWEDLLEKEMATHSSILA